MALCFTVSWKQQCKGDVECLCPWDLNRRLDYIYCTSAVDSSTSEDPIPHKTKFLLQLQTIHSKVSSFIVFGDSSVDSGNNNHISTILKSNFGPYGRDFYGGQPTGRFSNGRIPTDFISEAFGMKPIVPPYLDPSYYITDFVTGVCFASAGTGYDNATSDVLVSPPRVSTSVRI
ncbi:hypothetical protein RJ640_004765 [Escallonia rubra]|uniref:GDSL esterase/lipase n=1 Tax=Escallonia rubra TaxID=112253 RepID=A0AA88RK04_9ASTE|nr:hypothetical protein RJ640_004765 [Escallonia rubra]